MKDIADIRRDYQKASLNETTAGDDPILFFQHWFREAQEAGVEEVNAMTLATISKDGFPNARVLLLKGIEQNEFIFFTNYNSAKGADLDHNPHAAVVFFWKELERQVRIKGIATRISPEKSDEYFRIRPAGSRIGAWASPQSSVVPDRDTIERAYAEYEQRYSGKDIPRPPHWGGYSLKPVSIEFWQGRSNRLHDRILFTLNADHTWRKQRLAP